MGCGDPHLRGGCRNPHCYACGYGTARGAVARVYDKDGLGLKPPLSLIFYKIFVTCANEINGFRILYAC